MNAARNPARDDGEPLRSPLTEPIQHIGRGHPEYHFVQSVMELRAAIHQLDVEHKVGMTRLEGKVDAIQGATDGIKKKVDGLVRWQTLIIGGTAVAGIVASALFGLYIKFGDRITIAPAPAPASSTITAPASATPQPPAAKP